MFVGNHSSWLIFDHFFVGKNVSKKWEMPIFMLFLESDSK
jgi:hypothetical protein